MLISFILWIIAIFASLILMMLVKPKITRTTILLSGIFTIFCGLFFYGYGFYYTAETGALAAIKTVFSVIRIFFGGNSYDDISAAPIFSYTSVQFLFWLLHFTGTFSTAAAALSTFGKSALRRLRLKLRRNVELSVIYGINDNTLAFGRKLARHSKGNVVFVGQNANNISEDILQESGCHIRCDSNALDGNLSFLRSIGMSNTNRRFHLYCLSEDLFDNHVYAAKILSSLEVIGTVSDHTALTLQTSEQLTLNTLQSGPSHYGYGSVDFLDVPELAARMLMLRFPPFQQLRFTEEGKATEDLRCVIVGFGEVGQAVLRGLVMNGQFAGSSFRADVFDPNYTRRLGKMKLLSPGLFDQYDITFHSSDARGNEFFDFLQKNGNQLKYIVLCTGSERLNNIIARELLPGMQRLGLDARLCLCDRSSVSTIRSESTVEKYGLYDPCVLTTDALDRRAMALNYSYCSGSKLSAEEAWRHCDYFSRISSRAAADFAEAMAYIAGIHAASLEDNWPPKQRLLENMAITEHLRWCAFHYAMGFTVMPQREFEARCKQFVHEKETYGEGKIRVGKDLHTRRHACLIPWEALDALSQTETEVTGKVVDYKQLDRNNVLAVPALLKIEKG